MREAKSGAERTHLARAELSEKGLHMSVRGFRAAEKKYVASIATRPTKTN